MPRGIKGSGPQKDATPEVEEVDSRPQVEREREEEEGADREATEAEALEQFNEHIQNLVKNFVQQEIAGLEQRVKDLEIVAGGAVNYLAFAGGAEEPEQVIDPKQHQPEVPDYVQAHQGGDGTPWFTG